MTPNDADHEFARLLKDVELPGVSRGDLAGLVRERFMRRRRRRGTIAAGCASVAVVATVVPLTVLGGHRSSPQPTAPASPLVAVGECAGTTVTANVTSAEGAEGSPRIEEIHGGEGNSALTVPVGGVIWFTADGPCADRLGYSGFAPLLGVSSSQGYVIGHVVVRDAVSPGRATVTVELLCGEASGDGACRPPGATDLAMVDVIVTGGTGTPAADLWHGQDGTVAAAERIACGPGPTGSNPAVAQEQRDTTMAPTGDQMSRMSAPHTTTPTPAPTPTPVPGERDYGEMRFAPPPAAAHPAVCAPLAIQLAAKGPTGVKGSAPIDVRLAVFSADDPAHINVDGSSTPYFTNVLAWEVVYAVDAVCYGLKGTCSSGPIPADGFTVVDATTGQVLVTEEVSRDALVAR